MKLGPRLSGIRPQKFGVGRGHPMMGFDVMQSLTAPVYQLQCAAGRRHVTMCPPLPVEWGAAWWVRIDDVWIKLRERPRGEPFDATVERELCALLESIIKA